MSYNLVEETFTARAFLPSACSLSTASHAETHPFILSVVPLAAVITASSPPRADASPNPPNPTLHDGVKCVSTHRTFPFHIVTDWFFHAGGCTSFTVVSSRKTMLRSMTSGRFRGWCSSSRVRRA
jgi:hypothetical protein